MNSSTDTEAFDALADVARSLRTVRRDLAHATATVRRARQEVRAIAEWSNRLPRLSLDPSADRFGDEVLHGLTSHQPWPFRFRAVAVITLPATFEQYLRGRSMQAVRTNRRHALRLGQRVLQARTPEQARELLTVLLEHHVLAPSVDQMLTDHLDRGTAELWFATTPDHVPFAMAAVAVDGGTAQLATLQVALDAPDRSSARYLLSTEIVASLIERRATHLLADSMLLSSPGVVYLQRRLGFEPTTIVVPRRRRHLRCTAPAGTSRPTDGGPLVATDRVLDLAGLRPGQRIVEVPVEAADVTHAQRGLRRKATPPPATSQPVPEFSLAVGRWPVAPVRRTQ